MKCCFYTFGCKVNTCETEGMKSLMQRHGCEVSDTPSDADIAVINSCTVTASGDKRVINAMKQLRKHNPDIVIVLTGCYPQAFPDEAASIKNADIITGTKDRSRIPFLIEDFLRLRQRICTVSEYGKQDGFECLDWKSSSENTRAFLKIQDGCNAFCSYCIIPYARGRCRSMPLDKLREQAMGLVLSGHREIVLCGINLAFYGQEYGLTLLDAVKACQEAGAERIRLGSLEPERMTEELLAGLSSIPEFCPQFHLSLQSGSDTVLRRMNRRYTAKEYEGICALVRKYFPMCAITTDIMTGFPQETDEEFSETLSFAEKIGFAKIHVFRYSVRPGTKAAEMSGQVPENKKTDRADKLQRLSESMQLRHNKSLENRVIPVLFEREKGDGYHAGHAPDGTVIKIPEKNIKKSLRKSIFYVRIEESDAACCYGVIDGGSSANPL